MQEQEAPFTVEQLHAAMEVAHEHTWALTPELKAAIFQEVGGVLDGVMTEYRVNFNPTSALGRAVVSAMSVTFQLGLEIGHHLATSADT